MRRIYIVNGAPGCGKTTFERMVKEQFPQTAIISTIDYVKQIAKFCGWDGRKTPESRKFLSELKRILGEFNDGPVSVVKYKVYKFFEENSDGIVFIDCREPREIERLCNELNGVSLLIRRASIESNDTSNDSDKNVFDYEYDIIIENNDSIDELRGRAREFVEKENPVD